MKIEQAEALDLICYYAKEHLKDDKIMSQSIDIAKDIIKKALREGEKKDKALEIIKRTHLNIGAFMLLCKGDREYTPNTTYEQYVCFCEKQGDILGDKIHSFPCYRMTKEEYELVLGVLYE